MTPIRRRDLLGPRNTSNNISFGLESKLRCDVGERMISACVFPTVKHGGGVKVWGCFAGDTVSDLFRIRHT
jgi:hypothetical protein